jgi:hypothetical protein
VLSSRPGVVVGMDGYRHRSCLTLNAHTTHTDAAARRCLVRRMEADGQNYKTNSVERGSPVSGGRRSGCVEGVQPECGRPWIEAELS